MNGGGFGILPLLVDIQNRVFCRDAVGSAYVVTVRAGQDLLRTGCAVFDTNAIYNTLACRSALALLQRGIDSSVAMMQWCVSSLTYQHGPEPLSRRVSP